MAKLTQNPDGSLEYNSNGNGAKSAVKEDQVLIAVLTKIREQLSAHTVILNEVLKPDVVEIKQHLAKQNGRIGSIEKQAIIFEKKIDDVEKGVEGVTANCNKVQADKMEAIKEAEFRKERLLDNKHKRLLRIIGIIGLCITVITAANGIFNGGTRVMGRAAYNRVESEIDSLTSKVKRLQRSDSAFFRNESLKN